MVRMKEFPISHDKFFYEVYLYYNPMFLMVSIVYLWMLCSAFLKTEAYWSQGKFVVIITHMNNLFIPCSCIQLNEGKSLGSSYFWYSCIICPGILGFDIEYVFTLWMDAVYDGVALGTKHVWFSGSTNTLCQGVWSRIWSPDPPWHMEGDV